MTYEQLLQRQPPTTAAGNKSAARAFVDAINVYLTPTAGRAELPDSQRNYLYKLRAKWQLRAQGKDESWNQYGSRPGRRKRTLAETKPASVDRTVFGGEDEKDPLLASLERKYSIPRRTDDI